MHFFPTSSFKVLIVYWGNNDPFELWPHQYVTEHWLVCEALIDTTNVKIQDIFSSGC